MDWLFLIVVCGVAALVNLDSYLHKIAFPKLGVRSRKQIRRKIFNVFVKNSQNLGKSFWASSIKNPAILVLLFAWVAIGFTLWAFGFDIYELYGELRKQIDEKGKTADEYRGIAIRYFGIVAGAGAIIGYIFATGRSIISDNQNKINARAQTTESMVQAIAQIGAVNGEKPNIEVRLGGLYSLQRIMQDNKERELSIVKILYAYVRENLKRDKTKQPKQTSSRGFETYKIPEDIQVALDIICQFNKEQKQQGKKLPRDNQLSFAYTDFSDYSIASMNFRDAIFGGANLSGTNLYDADLSNAELYDADLSGVYGPGLHFMKTSLYNTNFSGANLFGVVFGNNFLSNINFSNAYLAAAIFLTKTFVDVNFDNACLENVNFDNADLSKALNLKQKQISQALGNKKTKLPKGLVTPESWKKVRNKGTTTTMIVKPRKLP